MVSVAPAPRHRYTFKEYLELEEMAGARHEFFDGEIYAMAGGTPEHAAATAAITVMLGQQLGAGPFRVYSSDLRVRVLATCLATYPDVTVICGPSERHPESPTHVTNPTAIVEVLSRSTAEYDRGEKLYHYQRIASLMAIVLVDCDGARVDVWTRDNGAWREMRFGAGSLVPIEAIGSTLSVDEVVSAAQRA
jgi:Uma2 family endonuclease